MARKRQRTRTTRDVNAGGEDPDSSVAAARREVRNSKLSLGKTREETLRATANDEDAFSDSRDKVLLDIAAPMLRSAGVRTGVGSTESDDDVFYHSLRNDENEVFALPEDEEEEEDSTDSDDDQEDVEEENNASKSHGKPNKATIRRPLDKTAQDGADDDLEFLRKLQSNLGANQILEDEYFDGEEDEEDDDKADSKSKKRKSQKKLADSEVTSDVEDSAWGRRKASYYNADDISDDEKLTALERRREEESEARRLQAERTNALSRSDFMGDFFGGDSFMAMMGKSTHKAAQGSDDDSSDDDDEIERLDKNSVFDSSSDEDEVEKRTKSKSLKGTVAKATEMGHDMSDVAMFAEDVEEMWNAIQDECLDVLDGSFGSFPDSLEGTNPENDIENDIVELSGKGYLAMKARVRAAYVYNVLFYLSLRANPPKSFGTTDEEVLKSLQTHPCVEHILKLRDAFDTLERVIEGKSSSEELMENMDDNLDDEITMNDDEEEEAVDDNNSSKASDDESEDMDDANAKTDEEDILDPLRIYEGVDFVMEEMQQLLGRDNEQGDVEEAEEEESTGSLEEEEDLETTELTKTSMNEDEDPLAYYMSIAGESKQKRSERDERRQREKEIALRMLQEERTMYNDEHDLAKRAEETGDDDALKRPATWKILSNKGLTPYRPKENRNPRVKKRKRFEKAQKKLASFKRIAKDRSTMGDYAGEATGIKTNLAKSVKFG